MSLANNDDELVPQPVSVGGDAGSAARTAAAPRFDSQHAAANTGEHAASCGSTNRDWAGQQGALARHEQQLASCCRQQLAWHSLATILRGPQAFRNSCFLGQSTSPAQPGILGAWRPGVLRSWRPGDDDDEPVASLTQSTTMNTITMT